MANDVNVLVFAGRLVRTPDLRQTGNGKSVVNITIAQDQGYQETARTVFLDCTAWGKTAEFIAQYFKQGSKIIVSGDLDVDSYTDKDGNNRTKFKCNIANAHFGDTKNKANGEKPNVDIPFEKAPNDDDLPF